MIKIKRISNCNIFNGVEMSQKDFNNLLGVLELSNYSHTIYYKDLKDNIDRTIFVGGNKK